MRAQLIVSLALGASALAACPVNQYSGLFGIGCYACPTGATAPAGSTSSNQCVCPANTFYNALTGSCQCNDSSLISILTGGSLTCNKACSAGQGLTASGCATCPAGQYSDGTGPCKSCTANSFSLAGASTCSGCPSGSASAPGSSTCKCTSGYFGLSGSAYACSSNCAPGHSPGNGVCVPCPAGYVSDGTQSCSQCGGGSFANVAASTCLACPNGATSVAGSTSCKCSDGLVPFGNGDSLTCNCNAGSGRQILADGNVHCTVCSPGYASTGAQACGQCQTNSYSLGGATECTFCVNGAIAGIAASQCICIEGFIPIFGSSGGLQGCNSCQAGQYQSGNSCMNCPAGTYSSSGSSSCTSCPANSNSGAGSSTCSCASPYLTKGSGASLKCTLPASQGAKRKSKKRKFSPEELVFRSNGDNKHLCPQSTTACPLGKTGGFECLDLNDELTACGSCDNDCTKIPGARSSRCEKGVCTVSSCKSGFRLSFDLAGNVACRPSGNSSSVQAARKTKRAARPILGRRSHREI